MVKLCYHHQAVYIFENIKAQRVKVGMTIMTTSNVLTRLQEVNDKWLERKATCQICGGRRLVNVDGLLHLHVVSGIGCLGGNKPPLEKDVTIAEAYLEKMKIRLSQISGVEKGSVTRIVNNLEKRIERYRQRTQPEGEWQFRAIFYTKCAEKVEALSHKILDEHLDKLAPFGEVFCCSVPVAVEAVETALSQLGLLHSAKKDTV
jgi:hypothetical protein